MKHIVIFRTAGSYIDYTTYNCQELGLAKSLVKKGYKVSLIIGGPSVNHLVFKNNGYSIDIYYLSYKSLNQSLCIFKGWKQLLNLLKPDVIQIHEFDMYMSFLVSKWSRNHNIRCVLVQGNYDTTKKIFFKQLECIFNNLLGRQVLKNVNAIGCKTIAAEQYVKRYSCKPIFLTPIGLDDSRFNYDTQTNNIRQQYGILGRKVLLYIGTMEQRRNPIFLLELMKHLSDDYCLLLIGEGPLFKQIKYKIAKENINNVIVLGKRDQKELPDIYASADLFLLASNYEIYGMVILESMYFGCPVLSTKTAGAEVLINNEIDGCIIQGRLNIDKWVNKIRDLFDIPERLGQMGKRASNKIRTELIWDKACEKFIDIY